MKTHLQPPCRPALDPGSCSDASMQPLSSIPPFTSLLAKKTNLGVGMRWPLVPQDRGAGHVTAFLGPGASSQAFEPPSTPVRSTRWQKALHPTSSHPFRWRLWICFLQGGGEEDLEAKPKRQQPGASPGTCPAPKETQLPASFPLFIPPSSGFCFSKGSSRTGKSHGASQPISQAWRSVPALRGHSASSL